jgi:ribonuclease HI
MMGVLTTLSAGAVILVTSPERECFKYILQMHFPVSNNAAEYEALFHGLWIATTLGICRLKVHRDSLLVVSQANKE